MSELNPDEPTVLLIGTVDTEGVLSTLKTSGRQYKVKRIDSSADNWTLICEQFDTLDIRCALVKLTSATYGYLASSEYADAREQLLERIAAVPHAIFAYETLMSIADEVEIVDQEAENDNFWNYEYGLPPLDVRNRVNRLLAERGLELIPYRRNAEITILASEFVRDIEDGLLFRVYVPGGRMWANEADRLLQLFRDYLSRIGHESVRLDQRRTSRGIIYELFGAHSLSQAGNSARVLSQEFVDFSTLLDLVISDPAQAETLLRVKQVKTSEIVGIITRYAKEAKRLHIDMRQEREAKTLSIRHRLESELSDLLSPGVDLHVLDLLVDAAVPRVRHSNEALTAEPQLLKSGTAEVQRITINYRPQIVQAVNAVVAQEVTGDVHLSQNDHRLLELVAEHGGARGTELTSAVRELADDSAPKSGRLRAKQKLKGFVLQLAAKLPDLSVGLLLAYLEKRLGL